MITSLLVAIMITTVYLTYRTAIVNSRRAYTRLEVYQNAQVALDRISADVRGMFGSFKAEKNMMSFTTSCGQFRPETEDYGWLEVSYFLEKGLMRQERIPDDQITVSTPQCLAPLISRIGLQFSDGQQWFDSWDMELMHTIPTMVRISIGVTGQEDQPQHEETFSTVVPVFAAKFF